MLNFGLNAVMENVLKKTSNMTKAASAVQQARSMLPNHYKVLVCWAAGARSACGVRELALCVGKGAGLASGCCGLGPG